MLAYRWKYDQQDTFKIEQDKKLLGDSDEFINFMERFIFLVFYRGRN